ncbi:adenosylhomocysteinase [Pseudovibrio ascidiaceicola]|uniref:Adenosylhomocysteinase n=1 Tax=Pseudovibrio ascidiaceicola TaxID=285279 RepID=A0A1I3WK05_9HYPH|nr:adenosylhomocysteinase [Pseudovibrio ascidiaceicola]SFK07782.1 adenosylhomocysteinase [Pseudovibrio ascidiaceicola]
MPYNTSTVLAECSYDIADVSLAPEGTKRIQWAKAHMPIMNSIIERMEQQKPFKDLTIGVCLHVEAKTGVWMEALTKGGATVALTGSPGSTQDETAAALVKDFGVHVFSQRNETFEDHMEYCKQILRFKPDIIADNGADLHELIFTGNEFADLQSTLLGATEETTTGANRLREDFNSDKWSTLIINDTQSKRIIENRFGVGSSVVDGIMRATNVMLHGKKIVVIGYGYCGAGTAQRLRGMGAHVTVVESNSLVRLEAHMEGFYTSKLEAALPDADIVVTVTGRDNVLRKEHFQLMRDKTIIANAGHFQREIDVRALAELSSSHQQIRPHITAYQIPDGDKELFLLSDANLVNLSAGDGNPIEIMDLGLALQTLSIERIATAASTLSNTPQPVPYDIEMKVAELACKYWINH